MIAELSIVRVMPLGGCGEFGRNLTVYEAEGALLCVDCGGQIPDDEAPGVDLWIPDFTYLARARRDVVGWILTHAHEDHIAALPHALAVAPAPVYAPAADAGAAAGRDRSGAAARRWCRARRGSSGRSPSRRSTVAHSIPDACAVVIDAGGRRVVHTGDLKIDPDAVRPTDVARLRALGDSGVDLLVADSTNATRPGRSGSETDVARGLVAELERARGRIAFTFFSSSVQRIATVFDACTRLGRKVCVEGRGLREMIAAALSVGALRPAAGSPDRRPTPRRRCRRRVWRSCSPAARASRARRSGAWPRASIRISSLGRGDTLVLSSRPVPGNERAVARIVDRILGLGVRVLDAPSLHASGHAAQEELRELMALVRPRTLLPVHGGRRQMFAHANLAESAGVPSFVLVDGDVLELGDDGARLSTERVPAGARRARGLDRSATSTQTCCARAGVWPTTASPSSPTSAAACA